jgi:hypothetical protein
MWLTLAIYTGYHRLLFPLSVIFLPAPYISEQAKQRFAAIDQSIKQILSFSDSSTGPKSLGKYSGNFHLENQNSKAKSQGSALGSSPSPR